MFKDRPNYAENYDDDDDDYDQDYDDKLFQWQWQAILDILLQTNLALLWRSGLFCFVYVINSIVIPMCQKFDK